MPLAVMEQYLLVANTQVKCNKNQLFQVDRSVLAALENTARVLDYRRRFSNYEGWNTP
jgi:hypothetical protein